MEVLKTALLLCLLFQLAASRRRRRPAQPALTSEARLYTSLMADLDRLNPDRAVRPVRDARETVSVQLGLALVRLLGIDEAGVATLVMWDRLAWNDYSLRWDEDESGVSQLRLPSHRIWRPDIVFYNKLSSESDYYEERTLAVVSPDGSVLYIPRSTRRVQCSRDEDGVFVCPLKFGSWTYDGFKLDVELYDNLSEVDTNDYIINNSYNLVGRAAVKHVKYYPCCEEPYPDLTFTLKFKAFA